VCLHFQDDWGRSCNSNADDGPPCGLCLVALRQRTVGMLGPWNKDNTADGCIARQTSGGRKHAGSPNLDTSRQKPLVQLQPSSVHETRALSWHTQPGSMLQRINHLGINFGRMIRHCDKFVAVRQLRRMERSATRAGFGFPRSEVSISGQAAACHKVCMVTYDHRGSTVYPHGSGYCHCPPKPISPWLTAG
jgi:hypothetical protein